MKNPNVYLQSKWGLLLFFVDAGQSKCRLERAQALEQAKKPQEAVFIPECNEDGSFTQVKFALSSFRHALSNCKGFTVKVWAKWEWQCGYTVWLLRWRCWKLRTCLTNRKHWFSHHLYLKTHTYVMASVSSVAQKQIFYAGSCRGDQVFSEDELKSEFWLTQNRMNQVYSAFTGASSISA